MTIIFWVLLIIVECFANDSLFVDNDDGRLIQVKANQSLTLPCRPASPDYHVTLLKDDQEINVGENIEYNSKIGFTIKKVDRINHYGYFTCKIVHENITEECIFDVNVLRTVILHKPIINQKSINYISKGDSFVANCSVDLEKDSNPVYKLYWIKSTNNSNILSTKSYNKNYFSVYNDWTDIRELKITNATFHDAGEYKCIIQTPTAIKENSINIMVENYINDFVYLKTKYHKFRLEVESDFQCVVKIDSNKIPDIYWYHHRLNKTDLLANDNIKYIIGNHQHYSFILIKNLTIHDAGDYTMRAIIPQSKIENSVNVTLKIFDI